VKTSRSTHVCSAAHALSGEVLGLQWADVDLAAKRLTVRRSLQTIGKERELADLKSRESNRTLALPAFVVRKLKRHKATQAEQRLAAGDKWLKSDFVFTTRTGRPLDGTLVTRDVKTVLSKTWLGASKTCKHQRLRERECLDCSAVRLPVVSFHGLRHSCASLLLAAGERLV
jgi:integrase